MADLLYRLLLCNSCDSALIFLILCRCHTSDKSIQVIILISKNPFDPAFQKTEKDSPRHLQWKMDDNSSNVLRFSLPVCGLTNSATSIFLSAQLSWYHWSSFPSIFPPSSFTPLEIRTIIPLMQI